MTKKQEIEQELEDEFDDQAQWQEFDRRVKFHKCTCDLLDPLGHVMCPVCNDG